MKTQILKAQPVVEQIKTNLIHRCDELKKKGITPTMSVVLVGDSPASLSYIRNKKKMCEEIGAKFILNQLNDDISPEDFLTRIHSLNHDTSIHGIIIQLPVSKKLRELNLPNLVVPQKDIDGFHGSNTQTLYAGTRDLSLLLPCTPKGIVQLLNYYGVTIQGKHIVVIGRSLIVGKPLSMLLSNFNATVTLAHSQTTNLRSFTKKADIVISAIGKANFIDGTYFDPERKTVVIDVGMNILNGHLTGDVDQASVTGKVEALTPVPGGVGPMTVISLIQNLITATEQQVKGHL